MPEAPSERTAADQALVTGAVAELLTYTAQIFATGVKPELMCEILREFYIAFFYALTRAGHEGLADQTLGQVYVRLKGYPAGASASVSRRHPE